MDTIARKTRIIESLMRTDNENILDLLEEDLNISLQQPFFNAQSELSEKDYLELREDVDAPMEKDTVSEKEFWKTVAAWTKK